MTDETRPVIQRMPVTIQPGVAALMALLKADPDFAVDLKKGVVSEVTRQLLPKTMEDIYLKVIQSEVAKVRNELIELARDGKRIEVVVKEEVDKTLSGIRRGLYSDVKVSPAQRSQIIETLTDTMKREVEAAVTKVLFGERVDEHRSALARMVDEQVEKSLERFQRIVDTRVAKMIDDHTEATVKRLVQERFDKMKALLS